MRKKISFLSFIFYLILFCIQAQDSAIDSLKQAISLQKEDSIKVNSLIELGYLYYSNSDTVNTLKAGTEALNLAKELNFQKGIGYAYKLLGFSYLSQASFLEADFHLKESLKIFGSIDSKEGLANLNGNIGSLYYLMGQDTKAIEYHLKALKAVWRAVEKIF